MLALNDRCCAAYGEGEKGRASMGRSKWRGREREGEGEMRSKRETERYEGKEVDEKGGMQEHACEFGEGLGYFYSKGEQEEEGRDR